ncbi:glutamate decarboxylase eukaryotic type [Vibrio nigripulchritudo ATCC 27043]|uniref:pyridoxal-dependent aspartate 1-decarboxylase PanP n=1 Tax=Vibrio nigripulchritudo TaxID=28173 RepID=UPI00021C147C|nr:putative pyridoxal-dependent aspartate 1-decarboxylase [Vibrio nigripulchritudo]EGU60617.1 glutamate decarboxylase eukaryotic type [Vibrio nigripulchritudo ATCC 27043]
MVYFTSNSQEISSETAARTDRASKVEDFFNGKADLTALAAIEETLQHDYEYFLCKLSDVAVSGHSTDFEVPESPLTTEAFCNFLQGLLTCSAPVFSPEFVGHMTSALPKHAIMMSKILAATNQNVVKVETSNQFTALEKSIINYFHKLCYQSDYSEGSISSELSLGNFCSGGTVANLSALWVARNRALGANVGEVGLLKALKDCPYDDLAIVVSESGHYSLKKAADLLGIGKESLIAVKTDSHHKIDIADLRKTLSRLRDDNIGVLAIVGVAGATETGVIDPLNEMADLAREYQCHFHVDAAWGGASLLSDQHRELFSGIEKADSVTIDAHKQLYVPMGAGMVLFKDPHVVQSISHHANYIIRKGSDDLGAHTIEGSRGAVAAMVAANLALLGKKGMSQLIDNSIEKAKALATHIATLTDFELTSDPTLCILTYRYAPDSLMSSLNLLDAESRYAALEMLDELNKEIQETQRDTGIGFVSRTKIRVNKEEQKRVVFRVVLANPLTQMSHLTAILDEQIRIASQSEGLTKLNQYIQHSLKRSA